MLESLVHLEAPDVRSVHDLHIHLSWSAPAFPLRTPYRTRSRFISKSNSMETSQKDDEFVK